MKKEITIPNGPTLEADVTKNALVAIHRPLDENSNKGFVLTDIETGRVYTWVRLKKDATELRSVLEKAITENRSSEELRGILSEPKRCEASNSKSNPS